MGLTCIDGNARFTTVHFIELRLIKYELDIHVFVYLNCIFFYSWFLCKSDQIQVLMIPLCEGRRIKFTVPSKHYKNMFFCFVLKPLNLVTFNFD